MCPSRSIVSKMDSCTKATQIDEKGPWLVFILLG